MQQRPPLIQGERWNSGDLAELFSLEKGRPLHTPGCGLVPGGRGGSLQLNYSQRWKLLRASAASTPSSRRNGVSILEGSDSTPQHLLHATV